MKNKFKQGQTVRFKDKTKESELLSEYNKDGLVIQENNVYHNNIKVMFKHLTDDRKRYTIVGDEEDFVLSDPYNRRVDLNSHNFR